MPPPDAPVPDAPVPHASVPAAPVPAAPRRDPLREPSMRRLAPDAPRRAEILAAHDLAVRLGRDCYRDPATGYAVMTAAALLARGACCGLLCRHCPYVR